MRPRHQLQGGTRRALVALIEAIGPQDPVAAASAGRVADRIANLIGHFPGRLRRGIVIGIWFLEWGAPLMGWGLRPLSALSPEARARRLKKILRSRLRPVRLLFNSIKVMICLGVYSEPSVEALMGVDRRSWRAARRAFRDRLLAAQAEADWPPTPSPLGAAGVSDPEGYLK